jgi:uncharacterized DUF497 family protein
MKKTTQKQQQVKTIVTEQTRVTLAPENMSGTKLKKVSELLSAKFQANKDYKTGEGGIFKMRKLFAEYGQSYLNELNAKYKFSISMEDILSADINHFSMFLTEKEKEQTRKKAIALGKNPDTNPVYTFFLFENLVGRYFQGLDLINKRKAKENKS